MAAERISGIVNWLSYERNLYKELRKFNKFFLGNEKPNEVLTKNGEAINPLTLSLITAKDRVPIIINSLLGDPLPAEQQQRIRHAILFSLTGNYDVNPLSEKEGIEVGITLENNDAQNYLSRNLNNMVAFLRYWDGKREQHKESSAITISQGNDPPRIVLDFPQTNEALSRNNRLYIYTRPASIKDVDRRFTRIILFLKT